METTQVKKEEILMKAEKNQMSGERDGQRSDDPSRTGEFHR